MWSTSLDFVDWISASGAHTSWQPLLQGFAHQNRLSFRKHYCCCEKGGLPSFLGLLLTKERSCLSMIVQNIVKKYDCYSIIIISCRSNASSIVPHGGWL